MSYLNATFLLLKTVFFVHLFFCKTSKSLRIEEDHFYKMAWRPYFGGSWAVAIIKGRQGRLSLPTKKWRSQTDWKFSEDSKNVFIFVLRLILTREILPQALSYFWISSLDTQAIRDQAAKTDFPPWVRVEKSRVWGKPQNQSKSKQIEATNWSLSPWDRVVLCLNLESDKKFFCFLLYW